MSNQNINKAIDDIDQAINFHSEAINVLLRARERLEGVSTPSLKRVTDKKKSAVVSKLVFNRINRVTKKAAS